jgi:hypothetical protein
MVLPTAVFAAEGECEPGWVAPEVGARIERSALELVAAARIGTDPRASEPETVGQRA